MALTGGARLGAYEILAPIGQGGMGEVYRARDPRLGRDVAIKVLPAHFAADAERLQRFEQEARATAALNHPNVLAIHDVGRHEGAPYIVSELLAGTTLRERIDQLPGRKAIDFAVQIARGLSAAHDKGIVHRDLKPENVFITADDRVKILDFGLAKLTEAGLAAAGATTAPTTPHTMPGAVFGTVGYMAPEQVRGLPTDHRADLFALGAILYEMVSGRRAFTGETAADAMSAILTGDPPALSTSTGGVPPGLARLVARCLEKSPALRFQTATDFAFALEAVSVHSGPHDAMAAGPVPRAPMRSPVPVPWIAATGLLLIATVILASLLYLRRAPGEAPFAYRSTLTPLSTMTGNLAGRIAVSPDGRRLALSAPAADGPGTTRTQMLWVHSLDGVAAQPLTGTEGGFNPWWSGDGRFIAFLAGGKLKKIAATGGTAVTLADAAGSNQTGAWNHEDVILVVGTNGLDRVPAGGGARSAATKIDGSELAHAFPVFLPDGRHFLYLAIGAAGAPLGIYLASLDSPDRTKLMDVGSNVQYSAGSLLFIRDRTLMARPFDANRRVFTGDAVPVVEQLAVPFRPARDQPMSPFSASVNGTLVYQAASSPEGAKLTWFDRSGKELGVVGDRANYTDLFLSPDGKRASVNIRSDGSDTSDKWVIDLERGHRTRLTFDPGNEFEGIWSADGTTIIFNSSRKGHLDLYRKPASGAGAEELLYADGEDKFPQSLTPDGKFLLYIAIGATTGQDLKILPLEGERKPFILVQTPFTDGLGAQFSPDGRWVGFSSTESGRPEVYVVPFPGPGGKWQVSTEGGAVTRWRRDGEEILYSGNGKIMSAAVSVRGSMFEVGEVKYLFDVRFAAPRYAFDVTPDGQRILAIVSDQNETVSPLTLVLNWPALIKR
jgi:Tol biopolymer transport system component